MLSTMEASARFNLHRNNTFQAPQILHGMSGCESVTLIHCLHQQDCVDKNTRGLLRRPWLSSSIGHRRRQHRVRPNHLFRPTGQESQVQYLTLLLNSAGRRRIWHIRRCTLKAQATPVPLIIPSEANGASGTVAPAAPSPPVPVPELAPPPAAFAKVIFSSLYFCSPQ